LVNKQYKQIKDMLKNKKSINIAPTWQYIN
jgi:hypothetical protein